jgi:hypothetical protein
MAAHSGRRLLVARREQGILLHGIRAPGLTGNAARGNIPDVDASVGPPPESSGGSTARWSEQFWVAVEQHGWRYAFRELGWRRALAVLRGLLETAFAATEGTGSRSAVRSSDEVTREVIAEVKVAAPHGPQEEKLSPENAPTPPAVNEADYERFLELLERREREEREGIATRLVITKGREKTLYAAHLVAALLTITLAFLAVGLVLAGLVAVGVASAAVAILPGSGTFLLRRMWHQERSLYDALDKRRIEHAEIVDAIEGTLSVPDPSERNRLAAQLAERLQDRAFAGRRG